MATKRGRKRTSTTKTEQQRVWNNLYNRVKYQYKKMGRWDEFKPIVSRKAIQDFIVQAQGVNRGTAMKQHTPETLMYQRVKTMEAVQQQAKGIGIRNPLKAFYDLQQHGDEVTIDDRKYKYMKLDDGTEVGLHNGKMKRLRSVTHSYTDPETGEIEDLEYYEIDDMYEGVQYTGREYYD